MGSDLIALQQQNRTESNVIVNPEQLSSQRTTWTKTETKTRQEQRKNQEHKCTKRVISSLHALTTAMDYLFLHSIG